LKKIPLRKTSHGIFEATFEKVGIS